MIFTLTFSEPQDVTNPGQDGVQYSYPFTIVDSAYIGAPEQRSQTHEHRFIIAVSRTRLAGWRIYETDLRKVLFEFGKRHLVSLVQSNTLPADHAIRCPLISTASHPESECPFDPAAIPSPVGHTITVERAKPRMGF